MPLSDGADNQLFVFRLGLSGAILAQVVIFPIQAHDSLAGSFVAAHIGDSIERQNAVLREGISVD